MSSNMGLAELFIVFFMMVVLLGPVFFIVLVSRAILRRNDTLKLSREEEAQFARVMESMQKMEQRIENLETILMQKEPPPGREPGPGGL